MRTRAGIGAEQHGPGAGVAIGQAQQQRTVERDQRLEPVVASRHAILSALAAVARTRRIHGDCASPGSDHSDSRCCQAAPSVAGGPDQRGRVGLRCVGTGGGAGFGIGGHGGGGIGHGRGRRGGTGAGVGDRRGHSRAPAATTATTAAAASHASVGCARGGRTSSAAASTRRASMLAASRA